MTAGAALASDSEGVTILHENGEGKAANPGRSPMYSMQAFLEGKLKLEEFARSEEERPTVPHNVFDETLPIIDIGALKDGTPEERANNVAIMLEAAKSWGFFKITNHGVPLEVVPSRISTITLFSRDLKYCGLFLTKRTDCCIIVPRDLAFCECSRA